MADEKKNDNDEYPVSKRIKSDVINEPDYNSLRVMSQKDIEDFVNQKKKWNQFKQLPDIMKDLINKNDELRNKLSCYEKVKNE